MRCVVVSLIALMAGCTHRRPASAVYGVDGSKVRFVATNQPIQEGRAVLTVRGLMFQTDTGEVSIQDVETVEDVKHWRGALEGVGIGLLAGVVAGGAIGLASGDDTCEPGARDLCYDYLQTKWDKAAIGVIVLGGLGGFVGLVVGTLAGSRDVYVLEAPQPQFVPSGPPGSVMGGTWHF
jgi:hypothetical protein